MAEVFNNNYLLKKKLKLPFFFFTKLF